MELAQHQMRIFITLAVVLGAALVALICDLLKANNEQLRELAIELRVRREEQQRRIQPPAQRALPKAVAARPKRSNTGEARRPAAREALEAIQRGQRLAGCPVAEIAARKIEAPAIEVPAAVSSVEPVASSGASHDWGQLLSVRRPALPRPRRRSSGSEPSAVALPAGFQDGYVLTRLVQSHQPISGLVVSVGASQNDEAPISADVRTMIQSLLGPNDFAAQSGNDEFLLIYPGERGAQAQRKLSQIAEQLWDFQLRSMGSLSIQFSWGGVEVRSESIEEAITSATERMQETRRGRKILTMEPRTETRPHVEARQEAETPLRRAV